MTEEQRKKDYFVETKLYPLLDAIEDHLIYAEYEVDKHGEEFVVLTYGNPLSGRRIRVTGDSLKALAIDVLKHI